MYPYMMQQRAYQRAYLRQMAGREAALEEQAYRQQAYQQQTYQQQAYQQRMYQQQQAYQQQAYQQAAYQRQVFIERAAEALMNKQRAGESQTLLSRGMIMSADMLTCPQNTSVASAAPKTKIPKPVAAPANRHSTASSNPRVYTAATNHLAPATLLGTLSTRSGTRKP